MQIVRIVNIIDTRQYTENGDRWVPVPGSGDPRDCSRCGRTHEVHAEVELLDGSSSVVGTGCASKDALDLAAQFRRGTSRAKRLAALHAERRHLQALADQLWDAETEIAKLTFPEIKIVDPQNYEFAPELAKARWEMGDAFVYVLPRADEHERRVALFKAWCDKRYVEHGITWRHKVAPSMLKDLDLKIAKLENVTKQVV